MSIRICCVDGCDKPVNAHHQECGMHHLRMWRTGTYAPRPRPTAPRPGDSGYLWTTVPPTHPLFRPSVGGGRPVRYHRVVLFDKIGYGPHLCHWCASHLVWDRGLQGDHVDRNRLNNNADNLVPSCGSCNAKRVHRELEPAR